VLDGATYGVVARLPAAGAPRFIAYNPANQRVYVTTVYEGGAVNVYRAVTPQYERALTNVDDPGQIAVNATTNRIYVVNHANNAQMTVIRGDNHQTYRVGTNLLDAFGVAVDSSRNLVYAASIGEGKLAIIDGGSEQVLDTVTWHRSDGRKVPLRVALVNPDVGTEGHLFLVTSEEDGGENQLLLVPNGWPTLGTPVPLDLADYPLEGIALDPVTDRVWVTSVRDGIVSVVQDGLPVCTTPLAVVIEGTR